MNYVIAEFTGDTLDVLRRADNTIIVFNNKQVAEETVDLLVDGETDLKVYEWY